MRKDSWFRGALLSVLFFGGMVILTAPLSAQNRGDIAPGPPNGELAELRRSVIDVAEEAFTRGDAKTLQRMEAAPIEQTMADVAERLFRDLGEDMSQVAPAGLARVESAGSWWGCLSDYLSSVHGCWMAYNDCMQPRGRHAPNESFCKAMLDACLDIAWQRYEACREGPLPY